MAEEQSPVFDWLNLPPGAQELSLWDALHDAQIVSIQSHLLERTVTLHLESDHLLEFHNLPLDMQFLLRLEGVQSARVLHYAMWPGDFSLPDGLAPEEQRRLVADYQSKWREESFTWSELESALSADCQQVLDISNATLATSVDNSSVALRIGGHLNYTTWHEIFLRAERITLTRGDGLDLGVDGFLKMGEAYWEAFASRKNAGKDDGPAAT